jgi:hypothetical protein
MNVIRISFLALITAISIGAGIYLLLMGIQNFDPFIPSYLTGFPAAPHAQLEVVALGIFLIVSPLASLFIWVTED